MIKGMLITSMVFFAIAIAIALYSIIRGPSLPDRVISLDFIGVNLISGIAVISVFFQTKAFLEVILILGILAFISTIALSKYIERGVIIERKRNR
ncbi:MAG TPA: Na(+)/H(+) antiporter subunit F1 [Candidatus Avamphibacillus sp.]|nr:Na(+)/H(+) antiporter subunit F1 [Candidatus Avamphibacillus sp.]